jgi:hypothetical protein
MRKDLILFQKFVKPSPLELCTFWAAIPSLDAQSGLGQGAKAASAEWTRPGRHYKLQLRQLLVNLTKTMNFSKTMLTDIPFRS